MENPVPRELPRRRKRIIRLIPQDSMIYHQETCTIFLILREDGEKKGMLTD